MFTTYDDLNEMVADIVRECMLLQEDLVRSGAIKSAAQKARVKTLRLEKLFKQFRKMSLEFHK